LLILLPNLLCAQEEIDRYFDDVGVRDSRNILYLEGSASRHPMVDLAYEHLFYSKSLTPPGFSFVLGATALTPTHKYAGNSLFYDTWNFEFTPKLPLSPYFEFRRYSNRNKYDVEHFFFGARYQYWLLNDANYNDVGLVLGYNFPIGNHYLIDLRYILGSRWITYPPNSDSMSLFGNFSIAPVSNLTLGFGRIL